MPVTYTFAAGGSVNAADLNTNFTDVLNELSGLTVADLHSNSGILSTNLADRFATFSETIVLSPRSTQLTATNWVALSLRLPNQAPDAVTEQWRRYFAIRPGKMAYLVDASFHAIDVTVSTANAWPALSLTRNGTQLGGSFAQLRADLTRYRLANSSPFDNPITVLADGDYLSVQTGTDPTPAADTTWSGVTLTLTYKIELGA